MRQSISLCMIAKNEARQIARCINSAKPYIDQVVVVDTGSEDQTVEIARGLGAEVFQEEWRDDFSRARNASLDRAKGDWVLFLDCDEELDARTAPNLKKVVEDQQFDGYWVRLINIIENQPSTSLLTFRLFRNNPAFRFISPIHEQVMPSVIHHSGPERIGRVNVDILHYGYEIDETVMKDKTERNLRILLKAREEMGELGFIDFYLGVEQQKLGEYQKALECFESSLAKTPLSESYAPVMIRSMGFCLLHLGRFQEALKLIDAYTGVYPDYTDLFCLRGLLQMEREDYPGALEAFNQAIAMGPPPERYFSVLGIGDEKPRRIIHSLLDSLLREAHGLLEQRLLSQCFQVLSLVFDQLRRTPNARQYRLLIEAGLEMKNRAHLLIAGGTVEDS